MFSLFLLVASSVSCFAAPEAVEMTNLFCGLRREVVAVDPIDHKYWPYFVELHRCSGSYSTQSPNMFRCAAKQWKEIPVKVHLAAESKSYTVTLQNHTACDKECVASSDNCRNDYEFWDKKNCRCKCLFSTAPHEPKEGFRWNEHECRFECGVPKPCLNINQEWDKKTCGCTCTMEVVEKCRQQKTGLDFEKCTCVDVEAVTSARSATSRSAHIFIILMIGEGLLIIALVCVIIHWVRKARCKSKDQPECGNSENEDEEAEKKELCAVTVPKGSMDSLGVDGCVVGPPELV